MSINKKFIIVSAVGVALFNPLSTNLIADGMVVAINLISMYLIEASAYVMVACATLAFVGILLEFLSHKEANSKKLKKLKGAKTQKAGRFIEA